MSNQIFNFNSNPVRVEIFNNQPHFCLLDVCGIFEIQNSRRVQSQMLDPQGVRLAYILAKDEKQRRTAFINEPNLYRIIFRSEKPIAKEFQNWVFEEVLPQIRKTGKYEPQQLALPEPKFTFEFSQENIHNLVWLLYSHGQMNWLLGRLVKPLEQLGSSFSPAVYGNHTEYKRHYRDCLPLIQQLIEPLKQANPQEWQRLQYRLTDN